MKVLAYFVQGGPKTDGLVNFELGLCYLVSSKCVGMRTGIELILLLKSSEIQYGCRIAPWDMHIVHPTPHLGDMFRLLDCIHDW